MGRSDLDFGKDWKQVWKLECFIEALRILSMRSNTARMIDCGSKMNYCGTRTIYCER